MSRTETWVTKMAHVNEHVDQVLRLNSPWIGGAFAKQPSVALLPTQDRLFFCGVPPVFGSHQQVVCQLPHGGAFPSPSSRLTGSLRIGPNRGQSHPREAKSVKGTTNIVNKSTPESCLG
jgi:hypothetical protein